MALARASGWWNPWRGDEVTTPGGTSSCPDLEALQRQKDALRIQAAAVAAQQAALTEEEIRLQQKRVALEQQEQQLAAHLEEKRQRLEAIRDEAKQARAALQHERAAYEQRVALVMDDLARSRREVADGQRLAQVERQRLLTLRRRLKRRWHRQWAGERAALRQRERAIEQGHRRLEEESKRLEQGKADLAQARLRFNGDIEITKRQWRVDQDQLSQEQAELREHSRALDRREAALVEAESRLAQEQQHWEETRLHLGQEAEGLQSRVQNYRRKILDQEQEVTRLETVIRDLRDRAGERGKAKGESEESPDNPATALSPFPFRLSPPEAVVEQELHEGQLRQREADLQERLAELERLAAELADQRLGLVEECARWAQAQQLWRQDHQSAADDLEALGLHLRQQEGTLLLRAQALEVTEYGLRPRCQELAQERRHLEAWKSRLAAATAAWEGAKERLLAELRSREEDVEQRLAGVTELRERWDKRRRRQVLWLRGQLVACAQLRQESSALRQEWLRRSSGLAQEQRALAEQALAVEQYRQECIGKAPNPAAAEQRLEKLRRRWAALSTSTEKTLAEERRLLEVEAARLEEHFSRLQQHAEEVSAQEADLASRQAVWEQQQTDSEGEQAKLRQQLQCLHGQRDRYEQQLEALRDEVERLARLLLDETEPAALQVVQAA